MSSLVKREHNSMINNVCTINESICLLATILNY